MAELPAAIAGRITLIASDRESGASEILAEVIALLGDVLGRGQTPVLTPGQTPVPTPGLTPVARAIVRAQPSMGSVWNAVLEALASGESPQRFERFAQRVARAPEALARFGAECFAADDPRQPLRLVTLSFSRSVLTVFEALARTRTLRVAVNEGRPALEGRRLASRLASNGIAVTCFSDAAIGHALASADAVLVGADAVAPEWFLNKSGTRMLAAAASQQGVPVYVVATRDKFVSHAVAGRLAVREGAPAEIWEAPPPGVVVRNPYFEPTPLDLVTGVISDAGVLGAGMVPDVCTATQDALTLQALDRLP